MKKLKRIIKQVVTGLPLVAVIWASFFPLSRWAQQGLMAVTLIWFHAFMLQIMSAD